MNSEHRSQTRSISLLAICNIGTAIIGVSQAFIIGRIFGTTSGIEIYFAASSIYQSMLALTQTGQIAEIFTPIYHSLKASKGSQVAFQLLSVLINWMFLFAVLISVIAVLLAGYVVPLVVPGFSSDRIQAATLMFQYIVPLLSLKIIESLLANLLAGEKRFVAPEIARLFCGVIGLLIITFLAGRFDAWAMIVALWSSSIFMFIAFGLMLFKMGYRYSLIFSHADFSILQIFRNLPSIFGYVFFTQIYTIAITAGLSMLPQGSLAIFNYARKVSTRINAIMLRPISVVFFNHFSSALAEGDKSTKQLTNKALKIALLSSTFLLIAFISGGFEGLKALWLSDKFSESSVFQTYVLTIVFISIPIISAVAIIFHKINISFQLFRQQYVLRTIVQIFFIPIAYLMIPLLGLAGAAFTLAMNTAAMALGAGILLRKHAPKSFSVYQVGDLLKCLTLVLLAVVPVLWVQFQFQLSFANLFGERLGSMLASVIYSGTATSIAVLIAYFLDIDEVRMLARQLKKLKKLRFTRVESI